MGGKDEIDNLITLCNDRHYFAPNKKEEFDEYIKEECDGTLTTLIKTMQKLKQEQPELFDKVKEKLRK